MGTFGKEWLDLELAPREEKPPAPPLRMRSRPHMHLVVSMSEIMHPVYAARVRPLPTEDDPATDEEIIFLQHKDQRFVITPGETRVWLTELTVGNHTILYAKS